MAIVESADDVAAVARFAAENGLNLAGQGTGHGAGPLGPARWTRSWSRPRGCAGSRSTPTPRPPGSRPARSRLELGEAANEHGLVFMPGSSPDVGVTGYTLGGGLSWFGRSHGFACNRVQAIELVTADGEAQTVDAENDPDLFWALRGGGGGYAIVTALQVDLLPLAEAYGGIPDLPGRARRRRGARLPRLGRRGAGGDHHRRQLRHPAAASPTFRSRCAANRC